MFPISGVGFPVSAFPRAAQRSPGCSASVPEKALLKAAVEDMPPWEALEAPAPGSQPVPVHNPDTL